MSPKKFSNKAPEPSKRYVFVHGSVTDATCVRDTLERHRPDIVVNFAAESHVDRSLVEAGAFIQTNIVGTHILLEEVRRLGIRLIHISTDEIYGDVAEGYSVECSTVRPSNPYSASKASADLLVQASVRSHQTPAIVVRGSNNFGAYQYPEKLIPLAITNIIEGKKIPIHGLGTQIRTWIHVHDFIDGIDIVLHKAPVGSIWNIAGREAANLDVLTAIASHMGVHSADVFTHVADRPGADMRYAPSGSAIEKAYGWVPQYPLQNALPEVIQWYRENESWWKKVKQKKEYMDHYEKQRQARYF